MPYWLQDTLAATPALAWMFLGLSLPWALVVLPRHDWGDKPMVALLALAFGPALVTAWMFVLGSLPTPSLHMEWILAGTALIAVVGWALVWRKNALTPPSLRGRSSPFESPSPSGRGEQKTRLEMDEKLLIALIAIALVIRWLGVAYWPFTAYDALWVYGYEGRLYTELGYIPITIGYYPQFLPLQYTYLQVATGGVINDHTARAVIPFLHLGSILAAYTLGNRLFNRRIGIYTAAIWALYPHVAEWSRFGDLEIPATFLFTAAAAFFLMAWDKSSVLSTQHSALSTQHSALSTSHPQLGTRNYALIAGLLLGIGMWTKPTMGAFIWGVALLAAVEVTLWLRKHRQEGQPIRTLLHLPKLQVVLWTGIASFPLGAVWYLRNAALGHDLITMPSGYWLTLAAQSGAEFGWPLLAVLLLVGYVLFKKYAGAQRAASLRIPVILLGLALLLAGALPSIVEPRRMAAFEWLALAAGAILLAWSLRETVRRRWPDEAATILWALLLALPYFVTWFYSYSYHYRLSFPIVPLMILPTAAIVARWTNRLWKTGKRGRGDLTGRPYKYNFLRLAYLAAVVLLAAPGVINALYDPNAGWDWLWSGEMPDDFSRYASGNAALMAVVNGLQIFEQEHDRPPVVVAPGIVRLPFFFPAADIRTSAPTRLSELDGVDYFVYGLPETRGAYQDIPPQRNQVISALALAAYDSSDTPIRTAWWKDDGNFDYTVYELHLQNRFDKPENGVPPKEGDVVFGGFARYLGQSIGGDQFWPGRKLVLNLYWEVLTTTTDDYMVFIHLRDADGNVWESWDGPVTLTDDGNYYSTLVWEPGEFIMDLRQLSYDNADTPPGNEYKVVVGFYSLLTGQRVPVTINGLPVGDSYTIKDSITVLTQEPG